MTSSPDTILPSFDAFSRLYEAGQPQIVRTSLVGDLETPVSAFLKLSEGTSGPAFLLESVEGGAVRGRYSMIGLSPDLVFRCRGSVAEINRVALQSPEAFDLCAEAPLDALRLLLAESAIPFGDDLPPMAAGVFGYLGYDMVRHMEKLGEPNPDILGLPDGVLVRPTIMVVFDAVRDELAILTPVRPQAHVPAKAAYEMALDRIEATAATLEGPLPASQPQAGPELIARDAVSNTSPDEFKAMVARAKDYIRAGDVFQVVLSQRFDAPFELPALSLYRALRRVNPSPFLCYLDFRDYQVVCSSPEILVRVRDGKVTIRPIAGTRPRGATSAQDKALGDELLADEKERAEHLMLLDLGRNDVGRVSEIGSVKVTEVLLPGALQPGDAHRFKRRRHARRQARCIGRAGRWLSRWNRIGRPQGAGDADHRRTGEGQARALRRMHRLFRRQWRNGHLHRPAHGYRPEWAHARPGRGRHRP